MMEAQSCDCVELSALCEEELEPLAQALDTLNLALSTTPIEGFAVG
jgi:hypothetical protein